MFCPVDFVFFRNCRSKRVAYMAYIGLIKAKWPTLLSASYRPFLVFTGFSKPPLLRNIHSKRVAYMAFIGLIKAKRPMAYI